MRIISVANQKGGCGKTTVVVNLASALSRAGTRTLLIDNDPQGHASLAFGLQPEDFSLTTRDLYLTSDVLVQDARIEIDESLHIVPADVDLATVEPELAEASCRLSRLLDRLALSDMPYDLVLIDNPPHVGMLTFNALMASREVLVPLDAGRFSWQALERFSETLDLLVRERGHSVKVRLLASGFDLRTRFARDMLRRLDAAYPAARLETLVHPTIRLREAAQAGVPIDVYDPASRASQDFRALAAEVGSLAVESVLEESGPGVRADAGSMAKEEGVEFVASFPRAARVALTGDFTDWSVEGLDLSPRADGRWRIRVPVGAGYHEYKYIVDGVWEVDPDNPERVRNGYGQLNSVVVVSSEPESAAELGDEPKR